MTQPVSGNDDTADRQAEPDNGGWGSQAVPAEDEPRAAEQVEPDNGGWGSQ